MTIRGCLAFFVFVMCLGLVPISYAQDIKREPGITTKCGDILEAEFTKNEEIQNFYIDLKAGDSLSVEGIPLGDQLRFNIFLYGPTNVYVTASYNAKSIDSGILSASGSYLISTANMRRYIAKRNVYANNGDEGIGVYTLYIGCTLRDGTVINPGDKPTDTGNVDSSTNVPVTSVFSGTGFPGLAPVDFANAFTNELTLGQPAKSKIPPSGDAVLGYTFDASANDTLALNFTRASGNLNLGLVVLSSDNKVVFQASLVTSSELTTKFTLPSAGTYTIGIFRIDLLPPDAPEATAFQLTATLNP